MIARDFQELADAINVIEQRFVSSGITELGHSNHLFRMAESFARDVLLASNDSQVAALLREHPKRARAFLTIVATVREELEAAGYDISRVPDVPLLLYAPVADAVVEAVRAYRAHRPYLSLPAERTSSSSRS